LLSSSDDALHNTPSSVSLLASTHLTQQVFADQSCLPQLVEFIKLFRHRSSFTFYTNGSVMNLSSSTIKAGCAWYEINTTISSTFQSTVAVDWFSFTKSKLIAVITAVTTLPLDCNMHIYTVSKAIIDKFYTIQSS